jgi:hypothetical protein
MYIIEFGRGPDKKKRKRRNTVLRNAALLSTGATLGAVGAIKATRKMRSARTMAREVKIYTRLTPKTARILEKSKDLTKTQTRFDKVRNKVTKLVQSKARKDRDIAATAGALAGSGVVGAGIITANKISSKKEKGSK